MRLQLLLCAGLCLGLTAFVGCGHADQDGASSTHRTAAPAAQPVRVACVGDSNTAGYGADSYTIALAERLGDGYAVSNYGVSGTTAMASGIDPYSKTAAYEASLADEPDIVVLMFGTNDTNRSSWRGRDAFADEYADLVYTYQALDSSPTVLLCTPPAPHGELWGAACCLCCRQRQHPCPRGRRRPHCRRHLQLNPRSPRMVPR